MIQITTGSPDKILVHSASLTSIKKAIRDLYTQPPDKRYRYISLWEEPNEVELTIYTGAVVLNWYAKGPYDGPGGSTELFFSRVKEWAILGAIEDIYQALDGFDEKKLFILLRALPKE